MAAKKLNISNATKAEIFEVFMKYDADRNGYISYDEAHTILQDKLGFQKKQSERMLRMYDTNGDGQLSYDEFVSFYFKVQQKFKEMRDTFNEFDTDKNGSISMDEARQALRNMAFRDDEIEDLVRCYDANGDGKLDYEEFVKMWNAN